MPKGTIDVYNQGIGAVEGTVLSETLKSVAMWFTGESEDMPKQVAETIALVASPVLLAIAAENVQGFESAKQLKSASDVSIGILVGNKVLPYVEQKYVEWMYPEDEATDVKNGAESSDQMGLTHRSNQLPPRRTRQTQRSKILTA